MTTENSRADALTDGQLCAVQYATEALRAIAERREQVDDVIRPLNDIRTASRRAAAALKRFEPVANALLAASPVEQPAAAPNEDHECVYENGDGICRECAELAKVGRTTPSPADERADSLDSDVRTFLENLAKSGSEPLNSVAAYKDKASRFHFMVEVRNGARALLARAASANETGAEVSGECFIVIGHGESDIPEAKIVTRRDGLLDAVLGMIYSSPSDAPDDVRAMYAQDLDDEDCAGHWSWSFEIGGINAWRVGLHPFALPRSPAMAAEPVAIPAGWKAMPPSATAAMRMAMAETAAEYMRRTGGNSPDAIYEAGFAAAPQPAQADAREEAYVAKRMAETLATVYATIVGDDQVDENDGLNAIKRCERAAQVLRLEVELYRGQADARVGLTDALRRAREELSIVEWENDPPNRVVKLFDEIDALLAAHSGQPEPRAEVTNAARDVLAERHRQVTAEGWTPERDDKYTKRELAYAASNYAVSELKHGDPPITWPWDKRWWKPTTPRRNLVKAGALILAEIERLDRAAARTGASS